MLTDHQFFYMAQITYKAAINLTKCSILLLYLKIFKQIHWFKYSCWGLLGVVISYMIAAVFATIFQCKPIIKVIDKTMEGSCINNTQFWYANAGFSIATDIIILLLPMHPVYKLHATWYQKVALMGVFALGIFVVITSCLRVTTLDILATTPDTTYDIANVMWTIIEPNLAVICACLPILRPFIVKLLPILRSKAYSSQRYAASGYGASKYGTRSRATAASYRDRKSWAEFAHKQADKDIHLSSVNRTGSNAGSEESILHGAVPAQQNQQENGAGIQKTVEYSIQYSNNV